MNVAQTGPAPDVFSQRAGCQPRPPLLAALQLRETSLLEGVVRLILRESVSPGQRATQPDDFRPLGFAVLLKPVGKDQTQPEFVRRVLARLQEGTQVRRHLFLLPRGLDAFGSRRANVFDTAASRTVEEEGSPGRGESRRGMP